MSSILLSNPFVTPSPPTNTPEVLPTLAVTPLLQTQSGQNPGDTTSFSGSGTGNSNQGDTIALLRSRAEPELSPLQDATAGSIITAQAVPEYTPTITPTALPKVEMPDPLPTSPFLKSG